MSLWGASSSDESKPKNLTTTEKAEVFANQKGWVVRAGSTRTGNGNTAATPEVLVALGGLSTALAAATISSTEFDISSFDVSAGGTLSVTVNYNEQITVAGSPTTAVTNSQAGGGSDILSIGAQNVLLEGGTITDTVATTAAAVAVSAAAGAGAGTITAVA